MTIAIIGGGAAGFFAAIHAASNNSGNRVLIFERSGKVLSKVRVSGGGRCNVTHACFDNSRLIENYPRGSKELRNAFARFSVKDTVSWFETCGVKLKTENDGRMFPATNNSATIVNCLMQQADKNNVELNLNQSVSSIHKNNEKFTLTFQNGNQFSCDRVIVTTGGSPKTESYQWLSDLGHSITPPVPSLFTFNIPDSPLKGLEGNASVANVKLEGRTYTSTGPVLVTHWGLSGPAILRLSAFEARWLNEKNYLVNCIINWFPDKNEEEVRSYLNERIKETPGKKVHALPFPEFSNRFWKRLCELSGIDENEKSGDVSKNKLNTLTKICHGMNVKVSGKTTFKEEFVTCGGINLKEVNMQTMESKLVKGLFFAGEVLDIDGVTGGFNFQAAWTTGFLAGKNVLT